MGSTQSLLKEIFKGPIVSVFNSFYLREADADRKAFLSLKIMLFV